MFYCLFTFHFINKPLLELPLLPDTHNYFLLWRTPAIRKRFCFVAVRKGLPQVSCENAFELTFALLFGSLAYLSLFTNAIESRVKILFTFWSSPFGGCLNIFTRLILEFSFLVTKHTFPPLLPLTCSFWVLVCPSEAGRISARSHQATLR